MKFHNAFFYLILDSLFPRELFEFFYLILDKSLFPRELFEEPAKKKKKVRKKAAKKEAIIEKLKVCLTINAF